MLAIPQAVLCDRDGTLIREEHFLDDPDRISWIPDALTVLKTLNHQGSKVLIISNQSGVAREQTLSSNLQIKFKI